MSVTAQADYPTPIPDARQMDLRQHPRIVCVDGGVLRWRYGRSFAADGP